MARTGSAASASKLARGFVEVAVRRGLKVPWDGNSTGKAVGVFLIARTDRRRRGGEAWARSCLEVGSWVDNYGVLDGGGAADGAVMPDTQPKKH
jgi:hypothetical protein